jgi:DNA polymerase (family 10)
VLLTDGLQVDLRVVKPESFGAALQYFTGSKEHNVTMRSIAIKQGYKLNEYGLFDKETDNYITGKSETAVYHKLGLQYIEPELRENRGEIEAARKRSLPPLVGYDDVHGDFHVHSQWSDCTDSIEAIAAAAQQRGYSFVGITDHSQSLRVAQGLSEARVDKKRAEIQRLNKKYKGFRVLCGTECDIKADGTLDYSDRILKKFDFVCIGIHSSFKMERKDMTKRITSGMENEHVDFLAHPTGRLIGRREPYEVDIEQIIDVAASTSTFLEINAFPDRLDLNDIHAKQAKEQGVRFVIGTDAHNISHLPFMRLGVATARRGWLEKRDILNTYALKDIQKILGR